MICELRRRIVAEGAGDGTVTDMGSLLSATTKLVAFYPHNTEVPTHHATIVLFKPFFPKRDGLVA